MAGAYLEIIQGDSYSFSTNVAVDGAAQNVYGADITFYAVANEDVDLDDPTPIINASTTSGQIAISGASNNAITVTLNSAYTQNVELAALAHWFLRAELANGSVYTLDRGRCCVIAGLPSL